MKKLAAVFVGLSLLLSFGRTHAQSPTITMVGNTPSFSKGNINTEVLAQIIQSKQDEIKRVIFRNVIIKHFNQSTYECKLRNFTTYSYIFNAMVVVTSGKNKTVITKSLIENASEFAYIYGLVMYLQTVLPASGQQTVGRFKVNYNVLEAAKVKIKSLGDTTKVRKGKVALPETTVSPAEDEMVEVQISPDIKDFNFLIDLCYDILLTKPELHPEFTMSTDLKNNQFKTWYEADNVYQIALRLDSGRNASVYGAYRTLVEQEIKKFNELVNASKMLLDKGKELINYPTTTIDGKRLLAAFSDANKVELLSYAGMLGLSPSQQTMVDNFINQLTSSKDQLVPLFHFYSNLKKSEFKDFSLTKDQYYALKFITVHFMKLAKNQFKNDVVSGVLNFLIENTLVEYETANGSAIIAEKDADVKDRGYLAIDIEAVITAVHEHFVPSERKGKEWQFTLTLGTNQASFLRNNALSVNDQGQDESIDQLYFASEKIGVKYKIWNWKYTHAFAPGEKFTFRKYKNSYWLRPQHKPAISDWHVIAYASGILYNLANLKSNDNFNYAILGVGTGITFFNGLSVNVSFARPFTDKSFKGENTFFNFGIDIPIIEYIAALAKK